MKRSFFRMLLSLLFISAFVYLYLQPTASIPFQDSIVVIVGVQLVATAIGNRYGGSSNAQAHLVRILVVAGATAAAIELLLKPIASIGFDGTFLGLVVIETGALLFTRAAVKK